MLSLYFEFLIAISKMWQLLVAREFIANGFSLKSTKYFRIYHIYKFEDFTINRSVHTRTLEGDGEKPSRHENEGPLLIRFFYFGFMMDVSQRRTSQNISKFQSFDKARNAVVEISPYT